jgi:hypothetical protein
VQSYLSVANQHGSGGNDWPEGQVQRLKLERQRDHAVYGVCPRQPQIALAVIVNCGWGAGVAAPIAARCLTALGQYEQKTWLRCRDLAQPHRQTAMTVDVAELVALTTNGGPSPGSCREAAVASDAVNGSAAATDKAAKAKSGRSGCQRPALSWR